MSLERVLKALTKLGLSQKEAKVYIYLATKGPQKAKNIAETLKLNKQHLGATLKNLQSKRIIKVTRDYAAQFSALPFEKALDLLTEAQRKEAQSIEKNKKEIITNWRAITPRNATSH